MNRFNKSANTIGFQIFGTGTLIFYLIYSFSYQSLNPLDWSIAGRLFCCFICLSFGIGVWIMMVKVKEDLESKYGKEEDEKESRWQKRLKQVQEEARKAREKKEAENGK